MRVLILASQVSSYHNARFVGATHYFDEVHVLSTVNAGAFPEFIARSLGEYTLHQLYDGRDAYVKAVERGMVRREVIEKIEKIAPDAVVAAGWTAPESIAALLYGVLNGIPAIVMSESQLDDGPRSDFREKIKRFVVSRFNAALVGGDSHADYISALGMPKDRIYLGYNAVENEHFESGALQAISNDQDVRKKLGLPERYVLVSGRFIEKKNIPNLILAYAAALQNIHKAPDLVILGDGPDRAAILSAIAECELGSRVHLHGFRGYDVLPAYYGLSEGFVHVSKSEQWGLVINEAMAASVPVLASNRCGAARTMINDGINGFLTEPDAENISKALVDLFSLSTEGRTEIGRAARATVSKWGPERFGAGLKGAVESVGSLAPRRTSLLEQAVFGYLSRRVISKVP